jgi:hypothetical protein
MKLFNFIKPIFILIFLPVALMGQSPGIVDVYLKSGSILHGRILEQMPENKVRLEIIGLNQLVIPMSEIERIDSLSKQKLPGNDKVWPFEIKSSVQFYGGDENAAGFSFTGYYHLPFRISAGIGTGIDIYSYQVLPVFAEIKYDIFNNDITPYLYGRAGYSFPLSKENTDQWYNLEYKGGFVGGVGAGLKTGFGKHFALVFSIGYNYQELRQISESYPWYSSQDTQYTERIDYLKRIGVSAGFIFK